MRFGNQGGETLQQQIERQTALQQAAFVEQQRQAGILQQQQNADAAAGIGAQWRMQNRGQPMPAEQAFGLARVQQGLGSAAAMAEAQQPYLNPAVAQQQQRELMEAAKAEQQAAAERFAGYRAMGQDVGVIQDMRTLFDVVGSETLPTAAKGAFNALRFRGLEAIRRTTEAGALQQAEIELFNQILPEGDSWTDLGREEKYARLNQLEYWFKQRLENALIAGGDAYGVDDFTGFGREFDAILSDVPEGTVEGAGNPKGNAGPQQQREVPMVPGLGIPMPRMF